jgi:hypothetical protein
MVSITFVRHAESMANWAYAECERANGSDAICAELLVVSDCPLSRDGRQSAKDWGAALWAGGARGERGLGLASWSGAVFMSTGTIRAKETAGLIAPPGQHIHTIGVGEIDPGNVHGCLHLMHPSPEAQDAACRFQDGCLAVNAKFLPTHRTLDPTNETMQGIAAGRPFDSDAAQAHLLRAVEAGIAGEAHRNPGFAPERCRVVMVCHHNLLKLATGQGLSNLGTCEATLVGGALVFGAVQQRAATRVAQPGLQWSDVKGFLQKVLAYMAALPPRVAHPVEAVGPVRVHGLTPYLLNAPNSVAGSFPLLLHSTAGFRLVSVAEFRMTYTVEDVVVPPCCLL